MPIVAPYSPAHCFDAAIEAARIALKYRMPVMLLSDGYLANGSEPWKLPSVDQLPEIEVEYQTTPNFTDREGNEIALVEYANDAPWPTAADGTGPSLELIDTTQANGWVANWAESSWDRGTPGAANSAAGTIGP